MSGTDRVMMFHVLNLQRDHLRGDSENDSPGFVNAIRPDSRKATRSQIEPINETLTKIASARLFRREAVSGQDSRTLFYGDQLVGCDRFESFFEAVRPDNLDVRGGFGA